VCVELICFELPVIPQLDLVQHVCTGV